MGGGGGGGGVIPAIGNRKQASKASMGIESRLHVRLW